jgi:hypothetical protein
VEYKKYRLENPYLIRRNPRVDKNFHNKSQEDVCTNIYQQFKAPEVIMHHTIELEEMQKDVEYFGEALAIWEEFGLIQLMTSKRMMLAP